MIMCLFALFVFLLGFFVFLFFFFEPIVKRYSSRDFCLNTFMNY